MIVLKGLKDQIQDHLHSRGRRVVIIGYKKRCQIGSSLDSMEGIDPYAPMLFAKSLKELMIAGQVVLGPLMITRHRDQQAPFPLRLRQLQALAVASL